MTCEFQVYYLRCLSIDVFNTTGYKISYTVKVQKSGSGQYLVNLPESLRKAMGIEKGDEVDWEVEDEDTLKLNL